MIVNIETKYSIGDNIYIWHYDIKDHGMDYALVPVKSIKLIYNQSKKKFETYYFCPDSSASSILYDDDWFCEEPLKLSQKNLGKEGILGTLEYAEKYKQYYNKYVYDS